MSIRKRRVGSTSISEPWAPSTILSAHRSSGLLAFEPFFWIPSKPNLLLWQGQVNCCLVAAPEVGVGVELGDLEEYALNVWLSFRRPAGN